MTFAGRSARCFRRDRLSDRPNPPRQAIVPFVGKTTEASISDQMTNVIPASTGVGCNIRASSDGSVVKLAAVVRPAALQAAPTRSSSTGRATAATSSAARVNSHRIPPGQTPSRIWSCPRKAAIAPRSPSNGRAAARPAPRRFPKSQGQLCGCQVLDLLAQIEPQLPQPQPTRAPPGRRPSSRVSELSVAYRLP